MIMLTRFHSYILLCFYILITSSKCSPLNSSVWDSSTQYNNNNNRLSSRSKYIVIPDISLSKNSPTSANRLLLSSSFSSNEPTTTIQKFKHTNTDDTNIIIGSSSTFNVRHTTTLTNYNHNTPTSFYESNNNDMTSVIFPTSNINGARSHSVTNSLSTTNTVTTNGQSTTTIKTSVISDALSDAYSILQSSTLHKTTGVQSIGSDVTTSIIISSIQDQDSVLSFISDSYTNSQDTVYPSSMEIASISTYISSKSMKRKHSTTTLEASKSATHLAITTVDGNSNFDLLSSIVEVSSSIIQASKKYSPASSNNNIPIQTSTVSTISSDSMILTTISTSSTGINNNDITTTTTEQERDSIILNDTPTHVSTPKQTSTSSSQNDKSKSKTNTKSIISELSDKYKGNMDSAKNSKTGQIVQNKNQADDSNPTFTSVTSVIKQTTISSVQIESNSPDESEYIQTASSDIESTSSQDSANIYKPQMPLDSNHLNTPVSPTTKFSYGTQNVESIITQSITSFINSFDNNNDGREITVSISSSNVYRTDSLRYNDVGSAIQTIETATISRHTSGNIFSVNDYTRSIYLPNEQPTIVNTNIVTSRISTMNTRTNTHIPYTNNNNNNNDNHLLKPTRHHTIHHSRDLNNPHIPILMKSQGTASTPTTTLVNHIPEGTDESDLDHNDGGSRWLPTSIQYDVTTNAASNINPVILDNLPAAITPSKSIDTPSDYELITIGFQYKLHYSFLVSNPLTAAQVFNFLPRIIVHPIVYYLKESNPNLHVHFRHKSKHTSKFNDNFSGKDSKNIGGSNINITWSLSISDSSSNLITPLDTILGNNYSLRNSSLTLNFSNFKVKKIIPYVNPTSTYITSLAEVYVPKNYTNILQWLISNTSSIFYKNSKENLRTLAGLIDNSLPIANLLRNISSGSSINYNSQNSNISSLQNGVTSDNNNLDLDNLSIPGFSDMLSGGIDFSLTDNWNINDGSRSRVIILIVCLTVAVFIWIYSLLQLSRLFNKNKCKNIVPLTTEDEKKIFPYQHNPYSDKSLSTVIGSDDIISLVDPSLIGSSYTDICEKFQTKSYDNIYNKDDTSTYYNDEHEIHYVMDGNGNFYYSKKNINSEPQAAQNILTEIDDNVKMLNKVLPISPINPVIASDSFEMSSEPSSSKIYSTYLNTVHTSMTSPSSVTSGDHVKEPKNIDLSGKIQHALTASYYASDMSLYIDDTDDEAEDRK